MPQTVVTTGKRFCDIDALACVLTYPEIVPDTLPVITSPLNQSVTKQIRNWPLSYQSSLKSNGDWQFVIVDVSEENQFPPFVQKEKIIEIYDHHLGFEKIWEKKLGEKAKIEPVGACATLLWEEFKRRQPDKKISSLAAALLYTAILSNTLNFLAETATERDKQAFEELKAFTNLPPDWISQYYQDQERQAYLNTERAVLRDTKIETIKGLNCAIGQMELWNSRDFIKEKRNEIALVLKNFGQEYWFLISPSLGENRTYIYTKNQLIKEFLQRALRINFFDGDIGITEKLLTRKDILSKIQ